MASSSSHTWLIASYGLATAGDPRHDVRQPAPLRRAADRLGEGIASNILGDRLRRLTEQGLISRAPDPSHKQKVIYSLTEPAIQLVPVLVQLGIPRPPGTESVFDQLRAAYEEGPAKVS